MVCNAPADAIQFKALHEMNSLWDCYVISLNNTTAMLKCTEYSLWKPPWYQFIYQILISNIVAAKHSDMLAKHGGWTLAHQEIAWSANWLLIMLGQLIMIGQIIRSHRGSSHYDVQLWVNRCKCAFSLSLMLQGHHSCSTLLLNHQCTSEQRKRLTPKQTNNIKEFREIVIINVGINAVWKYMPKIE